MIDSIKTLKKLKHLRKYSANEKEEENDIIPKIYKKDSLLYQKGQIKKLYTKVESEISRTKNSFAFSLGSRILKGSCNEHNQLKSLFSQNIKKRSSRVNKNKLSNDNSSTFNTPKMKKRKLSKIEKKKSFYALTQYTNKSRESSTNSSIIDIKNEKALKRINEIYNKFDDNKEPKIIKKLKEVEKCSILKYGIKPSFNDISYSFCLTCDSSLINPICIPCLNHCHKGHIIKEEYEIGKIICSCGERSHIILNIGESNLRKNINECLCNEWAKTSKLNICYINNNINKNDIICILCYNFCTYDKSKYSANIIKLKKDEQFPKCHCKNKNIHNEFRFLINTIEKMSSKYKLYEAINLFHPTQLINILINSKNSFRYNFDSFYNLYNSLQNNSFLNSLIHYSLCKVDFHTTNCFVIMKTILNILSFNNHSNISYYSNEVEKYFSFDIIMNLVENLRKSNLKESSKWLLSYNYLKMFKKVYIQNKIKIFDKYKIIDLDNFSSCQRFSLYYNCEKLFPKSKEIISFFLKYLQEINIKGFNSIEAINCLGEIFGILKKLAFFNLISNGDIIRILQEIEKFFMNLNILRNYLKIYNKNEEMYKIYLTKTTKKNEDKDRNELKSQISENSNLNLFNLSLEENENEEESSEIDNLESPGVKLNDVYFYDQELPLYYTIIKLLRIFYFNVNDRLVQNFICNKEQYPNNHLFNSNNISFSYMKNDFGRALFKVCIKILFVIHKYNKTNERNKKIYEKILYHGTKILEYSLMKKDSYLISLIRSFTNGEFYEKKINLIDYENINNYNNELTLLFSEKNNLDSSNKKFLNFEINNEELINNYIKSIDNILNANPEFKDTKSPKGFNEKMLVAILKSKYFFILSKIYRILNYFSEITSNQKNSKNKTISLIYTEEKKLKQRHLLNDLTPKILFFYQNFIFENSENSLLVLSHYIFNDLTKIPIRYCEENFLLFHACLQTISENNLENILNNTSQYLQNLYTYLIYLQEKKYPNIYQCLLSFLKCFYVISINIKTADYDMLIKTIRQIIIQMNISFNISKNYFNSEEEGVSEILRIIEKENNNNGNNSGIKKKVENIKKNINESAYANYSNINNAKIDKDILEQCFIIDLQLINDFFDFELSEQKEKITKLIDVHKIIYCLKFHNILHLALRTQMIRYVRKIFIDMNYNKESSFIYINSIINNEDNLSILKNNPLVNNYKYPTKLLSYVKDFWNLSMKSKVNKIINDRNTNLPMQLFNQKSDEEKEDSDDEDDSDSDDSSSINSEETKNENNKIKIRVIKPDEEISSTNIKNKVLKNKENVINNDKDNIKCFDNNVYDLLINELDNVNDILNDVNTSSVDEMQALGEYFQNGLLIPIIYFFKKSFAVSHNLKGTDLIKLYDLAIKSINLKITISEFKYNFWERKNSLNDDNNFDDDIFSSHMINNSKDLLINGSIFVDGEIIKKSNQTIKKLRNKNFSCFDYTLLYNIIEKNLYNLLNESHYHRISELFSEKLEEIQSNSFLSNKSGSITNEKLYQIYLIYKNNKELMNDENNSSLFNILPEICIEYGTNYRNLLIFILISNGLKLNINNNNTISITLYFMLYKLLSVQTSKTQTEIINLLGGAINNDNMGFMINYSQHLLKRIILLFICFFNPNDKFYNDNYIFAINLIKIFKYLCEEHNNFFQKRLIKTLNYQYKNIVPLFKKENKNIKEYKKNFGTSIVNLYDFELKDEKIRQKKVKFFDFFLFVLLKLTLISGWGTVQRKNTLSKKRNINTKKEDKNIYDLFSSIIEMLNEIVQGNKEEYLSALGNPFLKEEDNYSSEEEDEEENYKEIMSIEMNVFNDDKITGNSKFENLEKMKLQKKFNQKMQLKRDPFTCFLKGMIKFVFIDNNESQILFQLRNDLMQFFTSILEEKNCNEEVQKLIIKYISIHRVFNSISSILKYYFLCNVPLDSLPPDFFPSKIEKNVDTNTLTLDNYLTQKNNTTIIDNKDDNNGKNENGKFNINILKEKLIFDHRLLNYYYENYYSNKDFFVSNEFQLTNAFYKYIKLIAVLGKNEEIKKIIDEAESTSISTAIKKFEPNILNLKKDPIKNFNHVDIKTQIKLSKSLKNKKIINEKLQNKKYTLVSKKTKCEKISNLNFSRQSKKENDNFLSSIFSNANFSGKFSVINKINKSLISKSNINLNIKKFYKKNGLEQNQSSERILDEDKKYTDFLKYNKKNKIVNPIIISNNMSSNKSITKNINSFSNNIGSSSKSISKNINNNMSRNQKSNLINNILNDKYNNNNNENSLSTNLNINSSVSKLNLTKKNTINIKQARPRLSVLFKINKEEKIKYSLIPDNTKEYYDKDYIERFYIVKFFESITSTVEIRTEDCTNQTVIFTHLPEMIYLSKGTKVQFEQKVNRENEITKKNDLVRHLEYFHKEIEYYKNNYSSLSHWFSKIDFYYIKCASYIYALGLNLLSLFTIVGDTLLSATDDNLDNSYDVIKMRRNDKTGIQGRINLSINKWQLIYDYLNYIYLFLNGAFIALWIYFRLPLYYELDKIKYHEENSHKKILNLKDKLYIIIIMVIYNRNIINSLIYLFVVTIISSILKRGQIIFPFLLLAIIDLNETLKNVILSIKLRGNEFFLCFFLAFIFMYGLANIAFFYFNSDFEQELDYYDDNVCKSLIFCVLNACDSGLRARGGIGDSGKRISYMRGKNHYIKRLILDDVFFFLIVIISIDLVFGIIIGEFAALREQTQKYKNDREYHCFICHINKNTVEKNRENFSIHVNKIHNMWNYVSYMIFVKLSNVHDLNSINSYAREKIDNKDVSWLPSYKDFVDYDKDNKMKEIDNDDDFKIEDENINHIYVVRPN